jgi:phage terminase small subunit
MSDPETVPPSCQDAAQPDAAQLDAAAPVKRRRRARRDDGVRLGPRPLSQREQLFVAAYVELGEIKAAALAAGYSATFAAGSAYLLLRRAPIVMAIEAETAAATRRRYEAVTQGRVIAELAKVAFADPRDLFTADGQLKPIHALDDAGAANIAALDVVVSATARTAAARAQKAGAAKADDAGDAAPPSPPELRKIKCWDKTRALELLGRSLGLFKDRMDMEVTEDLAAAIEAARKRVGAVEPQAPEATAALDPPPTHAGLETPPTHAGLHRPDKSILSD